MPSQYIVMQYGDVMRGEFLNIGVFAYDMDPIVTEVKSRFLKSLDRVEKTFNMKDPILRDLFKYWQTDIINKEQLNELVDSCNSPYTSVQFTDPRASLNSPEELVVWAAKTFLVE